jgi:hypothetical protein
MAIKLTSLLLLPTFLFVSACAPDKNAVSDEERLNVFCSTKKNDREEKCQSDEVFMNSNQLSLILAQKINRELSLQALNSFDVKSEKIVGKNALNSKIQMTSETNPQGLQVPGSLTAQTLIKDLGATNVTAQDINFAEFFSGLNTNLSQLMNLSRKESKEQAASLGNFVIVNEKLDYSAPSENPMGTSSEVSWSGEAQAVFSKIDAKGKHFFSKDLISEKGQSKISLNTDGTRNVEALVLEWNIAPRKDAILNQSVRISGSGHQLLEIEPGCFRFVGEFMMTNTFDGTKKKPLQTSTSKVVLTENEIKVFKQKNGTFPTDASKTEVIPTCTEYDGLFVNYGLVL